jgi:hypothetical protein
MSARKTGDITDIKSGVRTFFHDCRICLHSIRSINSNTITSRTHAVLIYSHFLIHKTTRISVAEHSPVATRAGSVGSVIEDFIIPIDPVVVLPAVAVLAGRAPERRKLVVNGIERACVPGEQSGLHAFNPALK